MNKPFPSTKEVEAARKQYPLENFGGNVSTSPGQQVQIVASSTDKSDDVW